MAVELILPIEFVRPRRTNDVLRTLAVGAVSTPSWTPTSSTASLPASAHA